MAEKELRKMSRTELIEIIYALQQNEKQLRSEIDDLKNKLNEKTICIENSGSIAEAALRLNHIFEDAEAAAAQYVESVRKASESSFDAALTALDSGAADGGEGSDANDG